MVMLGEFSPVFKKKKKKKNIYIYIWYFEVPHQGASTEYRQHVFLLRNKKIYPGVLTKYSSITSHLYTNSSESPLAFSIAHSDHGDYR